MMNPQPEETIPPQTLYPLCHAESLDSMNLIMNNIERLNFAHWSRNGNATFRFTHTVRTQTNLLAIKRTLHAAPDARIYAGGNDRVTREKERKRVRVRVRETETAALFVLVTSSSRS